MEPTEIRAKLLRYATSCLSRQPYFRTKLSLKLSQKAKTENISDADPVISKILDDLEKDGFLDDLHYAEGFVRRQLEKGNGIRLIAYKLKLAGVNSGIAAQAIKEIATQEIEIAAAKKVILRYSKIDRKKQMQKLYQRGYSSQTIGRVFDSRVTED